MSGLSLQHLLQDIVQRTFDPPIGIMTLKFTQVADIANVISGPSFIHVLVAYFSIQQILDLFHAFQNGSAIFAASSQIINFTRMRIPGEDRKSTRLNSSHT